MIFIIFILFSTKLISKKKDTGGTGIGLAIANTRIKTLSGSTIANSTKGEGSSFTIIIPNLKHKGTIS